MQLVKQAQDVFDMAPIHFGALLKSLRDRYVISQAKVLAHLPSTISQRRYSGIEQDRGAPSFDELPLIYAALHRAGVHLTLRDRQLFVSLAKQKLENKKTHKEQKAEGEWDHLRLHLAQIDHVPDESSSGSQSPSRRGAPLPRMTETRHLVGRTDWLDSLFASVKAPLPKKLIVIQGPAGSGKTSEMHRVANHFLQSVPRYHVVLCEPPALEQEVMEPDIVLELLLGEVLLEVGPPSVGMPLSNIDSRMEYALDYLCKAARPTVLLLDNAEQVLDACGDLTHVWQRFLTKFLQSHHQASLILATKEWRGWFTGEGQFVLHTMVPPLTPEEGCLLLQRLGLQALAEEQLEAVAQVVGGIPQCLEWVAKLTQETLLHDDWAAFEEEDGEAFLSAKARAHRLARVVEDASLFGGPIAQRLKPLLERLLKRLSADASMALSELAISPLPLGSPALRMLYHNPNPLKELRDASLLVAYPRRVHLLPMVAAQVRQHLTPEEIRTAEDRLIDALCHWLNTGIVNHREKGMVVTELACLLLRRHRLLATAELILYHGWLGAGQTQRLARRVQQVLDEFAWHDAPETESGGLLLHYYLASYRGVHVHAEERAQSFERVYSYVINGTIIVEPLMEVHLIHHLMSYYADEEQFERAQQFFDHCYLRMEPLLPGDAELHATLLSKRALLCSDWIAFLEKHGRHYEVKGQRELAIAIYTECLAFLQKAEQGVEAHTVRQSTLKKKQASFLNNLSYHLNMAGRYAEALTVADHCIELKRQGYADLDSLAASLGEKSQILAALGRFQEALVFDQQAREEIRRSAEAGDSRSQEDKWMYQVNQGRLYWLIGRADEAERLLREAEDNVPKRRSTYQLAAQEALTEIKRAREVSPSGSIHMDWRWIERYRQLSAFDAYWWWAPAGPFTDEEQQQWDQQYAPELDEAIKDRLRDMIVQSRDREMYAAIREQREPRLWYPALDRSEVHRRIADFLALDAQISVEEPNVIVCDLYHGAIEDEVCFLRLFESTYEGNDELFWKMTRQLYAEPTDEEMNYALTRVRLLVCQGLSLHVAEPRNEIEQEQWEATREVCERVISVLREQFHIELDVTGTVSAGQEGYLTGISSSLSSPPLISAQAAKRFFEAVLQLNGYEGWSVVLDPNVQGPRVESGLRQLFLPADPLPLDELKEYLSHEVAGHVARSVAGEASVLGLLGIGTQGYMVTEEGLADYYERQAAAGSMQPFDDSGIWLGTLAVGLACWKKALQPCTFTSLYAFFEPLLLLYRLLWRDDEDRETAQRRAARNALNRCVRTFRGVPHPEQGGVCNTKDVVYLRGRWLIDQVVTQDETILDRLAVGKVAYELLPKLYQLGIVHPPRQSLHSLIVDPHLDEYIASFEDETEIGT